MSESFDDWLSRKEEKRLGLNIPKKRSPIAKVSKKQKEKLKDYKNAVDLHFTLESNKVCFLCGNDQNLSIHHVSKRGANIARNLMTLCMNSNYMNEKYPDANPADGCHQFVERNHNLARQLGLLK